MAITQTQALPAPFITALGEKYGAGLAGLADRPFTTAELGQVAPQVAAQDPLQVQAATLAQQGLGAYQPYLTGPLTGQQLTDYMSPYQQSVIDATMASYGQQEAIRETELQSEQARLGVLGAGRAGIQRAAYQTQSDLNRAQILAGLQQQGFGQAQQARQQDLANQLGIGQFQSTLGGGAQNLAQQQIAGLGTLGAGQQAQSQAVLDAQRQATQTAAYEPYQRLGTYGAGVSSLISGYPAQYGQASTPSASPLQTALGIGTGLAGLYGGLTGKNPFAPIGKAFGFG